MTSGRMPWMSLVDAASNFTCGDSTSEGGSVPMEATNFTIIHTRYVSTSTNDDIQKMLVPEIIHWHIYALPQDDAIPSYSVLPEGWMTPQVKNGVLQFETTAKGLTDYTAKTFKEGDKLQAAVNIYVPISQLEQVDITGVNHKVEIDFDMIKRFPNANKTILSSNSTLKINLSGESNQLSVMAPYTSVNLEVSGVESRAYLHVGGEKPSSISIVGVDNQVEFYVDPETSNTVIADIDIVGIDTSLLLDGKYLQAELSGVESTMRVIRREDNSTNTTTEYDGCFNVVSKGIESTCELVLFPENQVKIPNLTCSANTTVIKAPRFNFLEDSGWTTLQYAGLGIGIFLVVCICCCAFFCCVMGWACGCCGKGSSSDKQTTFYHENQYPPGPDPTGSTYPPPIPPPVSIIDAPPETTPFPPPYYTPNSVQEATIVQHQGVDPPSSIQQGHILPGETAQIY